MPRKRKASSSDFADFAKHVTKLYDLVTSGNLKESKGDEPREVRQVAFGLATIHKLVKREHAAVGNQAAADMGLLEAGKIVDALVTGLNHPIHRYIKGLRSGKYRPQRQRINRLDKHAQGCVVGLVRAIQRTAHVDKSEAIRQALDHLKSDDFSFTFNQIKMWNDRQGSDPSDFPELVAGYLIQKATPDGLDASIE